MLDLTLQLLSDDWQSPSCDETWLNVMFFGRLPIFCNKHRPFRKPMENMTIMLSQWLLQTHLCSWYSAQHHTSQHLLSIALASCLHSKTHNLKILFASWDLMSQNCSCFSVTWVLSTSSWKHSLQLSRPRHYCKNAAKICAFHDPLEGRDWVIYLQSSSSTIARTAQYWLLFQASMVNMT